MTQAVRKKGLPPIAYIILAIGLIWGGSKFTPGLLQKISFGFDAAPDGGAIASRLSSGETALLKQNMTVDKQEGVKALAAGNYQAAIEHFQRSLAQQRNDPETLIYLNNAKAKLPSQQPPVKIAVSVPIATNPNVAQEILRGVAQAQTETNGNGGINGRALTVELASDDNSPDVAKAIAQTLVNDQETLAVIGHNASNATVAAAAIYQQGQLPMITPTSSANDLSGFGDYIFRTIPTTATMAKPLAQYAVQTARKTKIAVCTDEQSPDNLAFKDEFIQALMPLGGQIVPIACNFSDATFNPARVIIDATNQGANGLLLAPHIDRIHQALAVARANQGQLALFSSSTLYTSQTLEKGKTAVKGLVLPVIWHPQLSRDREFLHHATQLWGGTVNWRTATSYDAAIAIMTGLRQQPNRQGLVQTLRNSTFSAVGASGTVQFSPKGDRVGNPILVQVQADGDRYTFMPLTGINSSN